MASIAITEQKKLQKIIDNPKIKNRLHSILGNRAGAFAASIINIYNSNDKLQDCDPISIISAAMEAAAMDLPIDGNLGCSALIPYETKKGKKAQFQLMLNGYIALTLRSGQCENLHGTEIYADEFVRYSPLTGDLEVIDVIDGDRDNQRKEKIVGYSAYIKLINGFKKTEYWTVKRIREHAKKYSKGYGNGNSLWDTDFHVMALKTVMKALISKWAPKSIDYVIQRAMKLDQAVIENIDDGHDIIEYVDNPTQKKEIVAANFEDELSAKFDDF